MHKKDYELIAKAVNVHAWNEQGNRAEQNLLIALVDTMAELFASKNPRFNPAKFKEACFK